MMKLIWITSLSTFDLIAVKSESRIMGKRCVVWCQIVFSTLIPGVIQLLGTFTPFWLIEDGVEKGFFYQINSDDGETIWTIELDQATFGLQMTSFVILTIISINCLITSIAYGPDKDGDVDNDETACFTCCCCCFYSSIFLYVCTGIFSIAGCGRFGHVYPLEHISASFYLCLVASLIIWLNILIFICDQLCKRRSHKNVFNTLLIEIYDH